MQIKLKNSVTQDSTPSASDLPEVGELAVNGNINSIGGFMRASDNSIVKIFGPGSVTTPTATTTVSGIAELATNAETTTGSASNRVVTPAGLNAVTVAERSTSNTNYVAKAGSTLTGVLTMPNGSNSAPAINFGDSDSGIFGGTNTVSLTAGGTTRLTADTGVSVVGTLAVTGAITSTSDLTIADKIIHSGDTNTAIRFPDADTVSFETGGSEALRVDSSQRLLVGLTSSRAIANLTTLQQIEGTDAASGLSITRNSANNVGGSLNFGKTRGAALGATTIVQDGDMLGQIRFSGADGNDLTNHAASIVSHIDGTPGNNDTPGRLEFKTTADGNSDPTTRLTIDSAGTSTFTGNITSSAGEISTTNGSIIANKGTNNQVLLGHDGSIEISRNSGGAFIDFKSTTSEDHDARIQENAGGFDISGNVNIASGIDITGAITGTGDMTIDTNTLHVDSSNNRVGIGTTSPDQKFHVHKGSAGSATSDTNSVLTLENSTHCILQMLSPAANSNRIMFGDPDDPDTGEINYDHSINALIIKTAASERLRINSTGKVGIGISDPDSIFEVVSTATDGINAHIGGTKNNDNQAAVRRIQFGTTNFRNYLQSQQGSGGNNFSSDNDLLLNPSGGNVGIGTTVTNERLNIHTASSLKAQMQFTNTTTGTGSGDGFVLGITGGEEVVFANQENTDMSFTTNNNERMRINSSGNVGIGTTTVDRKLHVKSAGLIAKLESTSANSLLMFATPTNESANTIPNIGADDNDFAITTGNIERLRVDSSGNVGIGTTSPSNKLEINNTTSDKGILIKSTGNNYHTICGDANRSQATDNILRLDAKWNGNVVGRIRMLAGMDTTNKDDGIIAFDTASGGAMGESMRIDSSGRLFLGLTTLSYPKKLNVQGESGAVLLLRNHDTTSYAANTSTSIEFALNTGNTGNQSASCEIRAFKENGTNGDSARALSFYTGSNGGSPTERLRIDSAGKVGINDTSPDADLSVSNSNTSQNAAFVDIGKAGGNRLKLGYEGNNCFFGGTSSTAMFIFKQNVNSDGNPQASGTERMRINSNGEVLVGTTSALNLGANNVTGITIFPSGRITAARDGAAAAHFGRQGDNGEVVLFASQGTSVVGSINVTTTSAALVSGSSDRRTKKNFEDWTEDTLSLFKNLKPQKFNFKIEDDGAEKTKGYIAQDLVDSFPEAYPKNSEDKYMFSPQGMVVYLMKAIQELEAKVAALEAA